MNEMFIISYNFTTTLLENKKATESFLGKYSPAGRHSAL